MKNNLKANQEIEELAIQIAIKGVRNNHTDKSALLDHVLKSSLKMLKYSIKKFWGDN